MKSRTLPLYPALVWVLLLLLAAVFLLAPVSDLVADARAGIPADHRAAFLAISGNSWGSAQQAVPGLARYVTLLELAYAVHEFVFALLFLALVAVPLRRREWWSWWACWAPMLASVTYSLTFGRHDPALLARSLVADIVLPVLLLSYLPALLSNA